MGQHSRKPSFLGRKRPSPQNRKPPTQGDSPSHGNHEPSISEHQRPVAQAQGRWLSTRRRRWTTVAVGVAVVAAASTTAWAAIGNDSSERRSSAVIPPSELGRQQVQQPSTPEPPAAAHPKPANASETPSSRPTASPTSPASAGSPGSSRSSRSASSPEPDAKTKAEATTGTAKAESTKPKLRVLTSGTCGASYYGEPQMTASGERFNPAAMTAAHKTLPLGSKVRVTNPRTGEAVTVRINDRGPYVGGRCLDLSEAAFASIGNTSAGVMRVKYEVLGR